MQKACVLNCWAPFGWVWFRGVQALELLWNLSPVVIWVYAWSHHENIFLVLWSVFPLSVNYQVPDWLLMIDDCWGEGSAGVNSLVNVSGTEEGSGPEFHQTVLAVNGLLCGRACVNLCCKSQNGIFCNVLLLKRVWLFLIFAYGNCCLFKLPSDAEGIVKWKSFKWNNQSKFCKLNSSLEKLMQHNLKLPIQITWHNSFTLKD